MSGPAGLDVLTKLRARVEARLQELLPPAFPNDQLLGSIRHSLLAPAKRVRALLTLIAARELSGQEEKALDLACSLEMIHAASLILDDLPAMDNALMRRGLPANHRIFGEARAILAAVGLLNRSFGILAENEQLSMGDRVASVGILHWAIGLDGLVRGQHEDLDASRATMDGKQLERMYSRKTGALFAAAAEFGAVAAGRADLRAPMRKFGLDLGVGFQVLDDVLDARSTAAIAGKDVDQDQGRTTFASLLGVSEAVAFGCARIEQALAAGLSAAKSAGSDGRLLCLFASRLASAFTDLMPECKAFSAANG